MRCERTGRNKLQNLAFGPEVGSVQLTPAPRAHNTWGNFFPRAEADGLSSNDSHRAPCSRAFKSRLESEYPRRLPAHGKIRLSGGACLLIVPARLLRRWPRRTGFIREEILRDHTVRSASIGSAATSVRRESAWGVVFWLILLPVFIIGTGGPYIHATAPLSL